MRDAQVACRMLGYGEALDYGCCVSYIHEKFWLNGLACNGDEAHFRECSRSLGYGNCDSSDHTRVICGCNNFTCSSSCDCVETITVNCDIINGTCYCRDGWRGVNCSDDIDECAESPDICKDALKTCNNTDGSYECPCISGYTMNDKDACVECTDFTYGAYCNSSCDCKEANTVNCDNINGTCYCRDGWRGVNCSDDIDECAESPDICNDVLKTCNNTDGSFECTCISGFTMDYQAVCTVPSAYCEASNDSYGLFWNYTEGGTILTQTCPDPETIGNVTRECTTTGIFKEAYYNCSSAAIQNILDELRNGTINGTEALGELNKTVTTTERLYIADVLKVQDNLKLVTAKNETADESNADLFLEVASFLLEPNNSLAWESQIIQEDTGAETLLTTVDNYVEKVSKYVETSNKTIRVSKRNIELEVQPLVVKNGSNPNVSFPQSSPQNGRPTPRLFLDQTAFTKYGVRSSSSLLYKTVPAAVSNRRVGDNLRREAANQSRINSQILSLTLNPKVPSILEPELEITLPQIEVVPEGFEPHCMYWNSSYLDGNGGWATDGCHMINVNDTIVQCACNHLTNFAILISPIPPSEDHARVLRIVSLIGCGISIVFLLVTITMYSCYWKLLKSDNATLTLVLSVCLCMAYILFIIAVELTAHMHKDMCSAIAVALHYLYLLVFFVMLAQGLHMMKKVMMVYNRKSYVRQFLVGAFIAPAIIVAISAGVSKMEGYGNENYCWLPAGRGVYWAFLGPVCAIILMNLIICGLIFKKLCSTSSMQSKSFMEKTRLTAWSLCVLVPVMGVTWVFGVFSVSEDQMFWQYIFVVFNTLQGFAIFLFHCLLNKQLRDAVKASKERKRTAEEFDSEMKGRIKKNVKHLGSDSSSRNDTADTCTSDSESAISSMRDQSGTKCQTELLTGGQAWLQNGSKTAEQSGLTTAIWTEDPTGGVWTGEPTGKKIRGQPDGGTGEETETWAGDQIGEETGQQNEWRDGGQTVEQASVWTGEQAGEQTEE